MGFPRSPEALHSHHHPSSEEDAGILHKHTDFRTNQAQVARNRKLIISSICTVANYEVS